MDAIVSFFVWPVVNLFEYVRFTAGVVVSVAPIALELIRNGKRSFSKYDQFFQFIQAYPLGKYVFSGLAALVAPYSSSISPCVEDLNLKMCTGKSRNDVVYNPVQF